MLQHIVFLFFILRLFLSFTLFTPWNRSRCAQIRFVSRHKIHERTGAACVPGQKNSIIIFIESTRIGLPIVRSKLNENWNAREKNKTKNNELKTKTWHIEAGNGQWPRPKPLCALCACVSIFDTNPIVWVLVIQQLGVNLAFISITAAAQRTSLQFKSFLYFVRRYKLCCERNGKRQRKRFEEQIYYMRSLSRAEKINRNNNSKACNATRPRHMEHKLFIHIRIFRTLRAQVFKVLTVL